MDAVALPKQDIVELVTAENGRNAQILPKSPVFSPVKNAPARS